TAASLPFPGVTSYACRSLSRRLRRDGRRDCNRDIDEPPLRLRAGSAERAGRFATSCRRKLGTVVCGIRYAACRGSHFLCGSSSGGGASSKLALARGLAHPLVVGAPHRFWFVLRCHAICHRHGCHWLLFRLPASLSETNHATSRVGSDTPCSHEHAPSSPHLS